ncbi:MAG: Fe-S oxidoreductase [Planctomycetes bacterium]|nr:Fe-S oxidoreductase [Planctomycetota bacterium]
MQDILRRRMEKPQRHRLLHSFPLAAAMSPAQPDDVQRGFRAFPVDSIAGRKLLVGVLPHPFCNPTVRGCGFCTFPHEQFSSVKAAAVATRIVRELDQRMEAQPDLNGRQIAGLYFGGGTANLTPAESFRTLCRTLHSSFDLSQAEVTLEGVPGYFIRRHPLLLDILDEELAPRHRRISMGIQSFDEQRLRSMGRLGYGTGLVFAEVVREAHRRGMTASGDLLFNLPNQSLAEMRSDVQQACDLGLDHLGLYHLVAFRGLKTAWSQSPEVLAAQPRQAESVENWLSLREQLLDEGFVQTSLTNFERNNFCGQPARFQYEESSFQPDQYEMLGLGPAAISCAGNETFTSSWKTINPDASVDYIAAVDSAALVPDRVFRYDQDDLKAFYLTRRLSALTIDVARYQDLFGSEPTDDFLEEFSACLNEGLLEHSGSMIRPTPRGMFFSDSISALLAAPRLRAHRRRDLAHGASSSSGLHTRNDNGFGHM